MNSKLPLHPRLEPFRKEIEATLRPVVRITATPGETKLWQSKFGGRPYIPLEGQPPELLCPTNNKPFFPYPRLKESGKELYMLAQINFEEMPPLENFPTKGIMQVFVDDDISNTLDYHILYYPEVYKDPSLLWTDFSHLEESERWYGIECQLAFVLDREPISYDDYRFENVYPKKLQELLHYEQPKYGFKIRSSYSDLQRGPTYYDGEYGGRHNKNKIGGYHYSQNGQDPREIYYGDEESILLIQFDGCNVFSWGDLGTACFFIKKEDLINRDFSNTLYHWDST